MLKMNFWDNTWPLLVDICPCDTEFNEWIARQKFRRKTIFHFGTGEHHVVGIEQAKRGNHVLAITASKREYECYVELVTGNAAVARGYVAYFGDIYLSNPDLLPEFDVVTMFHLCEFFCPNTASKAYGGLTDRKLLDLFTRKLRRGGHMLFYTRSQSFDKAGPLIARWAKTAPVRKAGEFKSLLIYRRH